MYKAIIFDLDGTLVNSLTDLANSCNFALKSCGYPTHQVQEYPHFVGRGIRNLVRQAMPENIQEDEGKLDVCFKIFYDTYKENCCSNTLVYNGINELLLTLKKYRIKLAVLSNKSHELAQIVVDNFFAKDTFDIVLGASDTLPRKPSPEGIFRICKHFNIDNLSETVLVGDSAVDINTARNAGIKIISASWGFQTTETLQSNNPDKIINTPSKLIEVLDLH